MFITIANDHNELQVVVMQAVSTRNSKSACHLTYMHACKVTPFSTRFTQTVGDCGWKIEAKFWTFHPL